MQILVNIEGSQYNVMTMSRLDPVQEVKVSKPTPKGSTAKEERVKLVYNFGFRNDGREYKTPDFSTRAEAEDLHLFIEQQLNIWGNPMIEVK